MATKKMFSQEFFRKAGSKGGKRSSASLTNEQRSQRARIAVTARWKKRAEQIQAAIEKANSEK